MKLNLQNIIFTLSTRPEMITENNHIFELAYFITGYFYGKDDEELEDFEVAFRDNFHTWVASKYDVRLNQSWSNIIYFYEASGKSVSKFLLLFEEFYRELK